MQQDDANIAPEMPPTAHQLRLSADGAGISVWMVSGKIYSFITIDLRWR